MAEHARLTLLLLQAGAPNTEILTAKTVADLRDIAQRHGVSLGAKTHSAEADRVLEEDATGAGTSGAGAAAAAPDSSRPQVGPSGVYEGERNEAGEWEGHGIYRFSDGASYEGEWVANQQHGRGTMNYASAASYTGDWRAGMKHGTGTYLWADGRIEIGFYDHDRSVGEARSGRAVHTETTVVARVVSARRVSSERGVS